MGQVTDHWRAARLASALYDTAAMHDRVAAVGAKVKRPGFPGGSGYWIPIKGWSVRYAS
ncbi:hypothetical protein MOKP126_40830 [Mycobacterium avium subsp. hominissuis]